MQRRRIEERKIRVTSRLSITIEGAESGRALLHFSRMRR
jgi:hypothetical protein